MNPTYLRPLQSLPALQPLPLWGLAAGAVLAALAGCSDPPASATAPKAAALAAASTPVPVVAIARGKVEVQGGLLELLAPLDASVASVAVQEGERVQRGQILLQLQADQAELGLAQANAELNLVQARQAAQKSRLPAARRLAQSMAQAVQAGAFEPQRADEALQAQQEIESAITILAAEHALVVQKRAQAQLTLQRHSIRSPIDASVLRLHVQPGSRTSTQSPRAILVLLPQRELVVRAELSESYAGNVRPGMAARISIDADSHNGGPNTAMPARVLRTSPAFSAPRLDEDSAQRHNIRVVDCFLSFDAPAPQWRVGQTVQVRFHD